MQKLPKTPRSKTFFYANGVLAQNIIVKNETIFLLKNFNYEENHSTP